MPRSLRSSSPPTRSTSTPASDVDVVLGQKPQDKYPLVCEARMRLGFRCAARCIEIAQSLEDAGNDAIATRPFETEHIGGRDVQLLGERSAQERAGAEHARADGRLGDRQTLGGFLDRHFLDLAQDEGGPLSQAQAARPRFMASSKQAELGGYVTIPEEIETMKRRIALAEKERDALQLAGQEEDYLQACSMVQALELQLEELLQQLARL